MDSNPVLETKKTQAALVIAGVICVAGIGYYFWRRKNNENFEQLAFVFDPTDRNSTTEDVEGVFTLSPTDVVDYHSILTTQSYAADDRSDVEVTDENDPEVVIDKTPISHTVFSKDLPVWDEEQELANRDRSQPYIIHVDEYITGESGLHQSTCTYYAGDDILADEADTPIHNYKKMFGDLKFGHGSNDKNVVYIRNERIRREFEVLYSTGSFAYEVLGQTFEDNDEDALKHSVRKFNKDI